MKTDDGTTNGKTQFYCKALDVSRQGFYDYLKRRDKPYKYDYLIDLMLKIIDEDECNDTYGPLRMHPALVLQKEREHGDYHIPHERTVYRVMQYAGLIHKPNRNPKGITKADKAAQKSDNLLRAEKEKKLQKAGGDVKISDFEIDKPNAICVTDITEIPGSDGKVYVSAIEDCFDNMVLGLAMADNMKAELVRDTLKMAAKMHPELRTNKAIVHSDRGSQYTSDLYRNYIEKTGLRQSMNSAAGRCHDNAKCESLWGRFKEELLYGRYDTTKMSIVEIKSLVWRYFMSYWNNRRICTANGGLPPMLKRKYYYETQKKLLDLTA